MKTDNCVEYAKKNVFVCCPFDMMVTGGLIDKLVEHQISPETGLNCDMGQYDENDIRMASARLKAAGCRSTVHAPFSDLVLGASNNEIRLVSVKYIKHAIDVADMTGARHVVFHSGYDAWHHGEHKKRFLTHLVESIADIVEYASAKDIKMMLENVYEPDPWLHQEIFSIIKDDMLGFCFDAGHAVVFSKTPPLTWLDAVGSRLAHLHLHDNMGRYDDHLPPGQGTIDFDTIFQWISSNSQRPFITLEPHEEAFVYPALEAAGRLMSRYGL